MTKRLLIRADDLGFSEAVNLGIEKSVKDGLIRSVGLMPNMEAARHGVELLRGCDLALGLHMSVCNARPVCDPADVPSLVDEATGEFKPSRAYREAFAAGEDFVDFEEAKREARAQLEVFRRLVGSEPDYFEGHAVASPNLIAAIEEVRQEEGLRSSYANFSDAPLECEGAPVKVLPMLSMAPKYDAVQALKDAVLGMEDDTIGIYVCHPGYLDDYILRHSSLTVPRAQEVAMLCDPDMRAWLDERGVELIDYRDL